MYKLATYLLHIYMSTYLHICYILATYLCVCVCVYVCVGACVCKLYNGSIKVKPECSISRAILRNENFDLPTGWYEGAEVCELVGSFILNKLTSIVNKSDIALYGDDGLGIFYNVSKPKIERKKKAIVKVFKRCGLPITIQCNLETVEFLDVTFDLDNNVYKPFRKENNKPLYMNKHSNHPPSILKQLPKSIEKQISETSSNNYIFDESIKPYKDALKESDFSEALIYIAPTTNRKQQNRKRKLIWFNPPFSRSVKSNIGRIFLRLLSKYFPRNHI